jgi:hypothetical protein
VKVENKNVKAAEYINGKALKPVDQNAPLCCATDLRVIVDVVDTAETEV